MRVKLGNYALSIFNDFKTVRGDQGPSFATVARWVKHFKDANQSLHDEPRCGRPITATTDSNIELVRSIIEYKLHCTNDEIEAQANMCLKNINSIIHDSFSAE